MIIQTWFQVKAFIKWMIFVKLCARTLSMSSYPPINRNLHLYTTTGKHKIACQKCYTNPSIKFSHYAEVIINTHLVIY